MGRYAILDGLRGYFLVFMVVNHLDFQGGALAAKINHSELGYVQDAQGFVFLSGLIVGLYYTRLYSTGRAGEGAAKMWRRAGELYRYAVAILVSIIAVALVVPQSELFWGMRLEGVYHQPLLNSIAAFLLVYQPTFMDILPQYIVYLLVSPFLIRLIVEGRWATVAFGSVALWLAVQFGMHLPLVAVLELLRDALLPGVQLRSHFNPLAWQLVFVSGLLIGAATIQRRLDLQRWFPSETGGPAAVAAATVLFFFAWRLGFDYGIVPADMGQHFWAYAARSEFGLVYLLNFAALAYLVAWLLIAGQSAGGIARQASRLLHRLFMWPFLLLLGRHSLRVYAYHVFLVYAVKAVEWRHGGFGEFQKTLIMAVSIASLALPALWHEWRSQGSQRLGSQGTASGARPGH